MRTLFLFRQNDGVIFWLLTIRGETLAVTRVGRISRGDDLPPTREHGPRSLTNWQPEAVVIGRQVFSAVVLHSRQVASGQEYR